MSRIRQRIIISRRTPWSSINILFEYNERQHTSFSKFLGTNGIGNTFRAHIINLIQIVRGSSKKIPVINRSMRISMLRKPRNSNITRHLVGAAWYAWSASQGWGPLDRHGHSSVWYGSGRAWTHHLWLPVALWYIHHGCHLSTCIYNHALKIFNTWELLTAA